MERGAVAPAIGDKSIMQSASWQFIEIIRHASVAGACRIVARREPDAASGLLKSANFHSSAAATKLGALMAGPGKDSRPVQSR
jgi:hypothetical protein